MKLNGRVLITVALTLLLHVYSWAQDWLPKIVPLQTTVAEVKGLVGQETEKRPDSYFFRLRDGNLIIAFSPGACVQGMYGKWNVPEGIVTHLTFHIRKPRKLSDYKLALGSMTRGYDSGQTIYTNEKKGVSYWVQFGRVVTISVYPPDETKKLECTEDPTKNKKACLACDSGDIKATSAEAIGDTNPPMLKPPRLTGSRLLGKLGLFSLGDE